MRRTAQSRRRGRMRDYLGDLRHDYGTAGVTAGLAAEAAWWLFTAALWVLCFQIFVWFAEVGGSDFTITFFGGGLGDVFLILFISGAASVLLFFAAIGLIAAMDRRNDD